jgi:putative sterol carrier protein
VGVKFLSEEWAQAMTEALNGSDAFKQAAANQSVKLQNVVTGGDGDVKYYFVLDGGQANVAIGEIDDAEATVTTDYETAAGLQKAELNAVAAFMSGKLKVSGNQMKLMQLQGVINQMPQAVADVEVEY